MQVRLGSPGWVWGWATTTWPHSSQSHGCGSGCTFWARSGPCAGGVRPGVPHTNGDAAARVRGAVFAFAGGWIEWAWGRAEPDVTLRAGCSSAGLRFDTLAADDLGKHGLGRINHGAGGAGRQQQQQQQRLQESIHSPAARPSPAKAARPARRPLRVPVARVLPSPPASAPLSWPSRRADGRGGISGGRGRGHECFVYRSSLPLAGAAHGYLLCRLAFLLSPSTPPSARTFFQRYPPYRYAQSTLPQAAAAAMRRPLL
jgi:hypothetical protein